MKALNETQRRAVVERILEAWEQLPNLRFGQLLVNSQGMGAEVLFNISDMDLATRVEQYAARRPEKADGEKRKKPPVGIPDAVA